MNATAMIVAAALVCAAPLANASTRNPKADISVVPPRALPEMAQQASQDLLLHYSNSGTPYLYLEQEHGARLVIFDVSDPAHIRLAASVATGLEKPYDFVQPVSSTMELIRFRDGSGTAILDLRKPKAPRFGNAGQMASAPIAMLGESGCLAPLTPAGLTPIGVKPQNLQVFDTADGLQLVATVDGVTRKAERSDTGTVFLLGSQGLTIVRRLSAEQQCAIEEMVNNHN
jgi:hypothetical protein